MRFAHGARAALALVLAAEGCSGGAPHGADGAAAHALTGAWQGRFVLDTEPAARRAALPTVDVQVVLVENDWLGATSGLSARPTHYGAFTGDFGAFGFDARVAGQVPAVAAVMLDGDSVELVLQPSATPPTLRAAGRLAGDSIVGRWWHSWGRTADATGTFRMARLRR